MNSSASGSMRKNTTALVDPGTQLRVLLAEEVGRARDLLALDHLAARRGPGRPSSGASPRSTRRSRTPRSGPRRCGRAVVELGLRPDVDARAVVDVGEGGGPGPVAPARRQRQRLLGRRGSRGPSGRNLIRPCLRCLLRLRPVGSFTRSREVLLPETSCAWMAVITDRVHDVGDQAAAAEVVHRLVAAPAAPARSRPRPPSAGPPCRRCCRSRGRGR